MNFQSFSCSVPLMSAYAEEIREEISAALPKTEEKPAAMSEIRQSQAEKNAAPVLFFTSLGSIPRAMGCPTVLP